MQRKSWLTITLAGGLTLCLALGIRVLAALATG